MIVTLLPLILAAGLLAAVATGALPFDQGVMGLVLLLCPGADRFLPLLREVLGRRHAIARGADSAAVLDTSRIRLFTGGRRSGLTHTVIERAKAQGPFVLIVPAESEDVPAGAARTLFAHGDSCDFENTLLAALRETGAGLVVVSEAQHIAAPFVMRLLPLLADRIRELWIEGHPPTMADGAWFADLARQIPPEVIQPPLPAELSLVPLVAGAARLLGEQHGRDRLLPLTAEGLQVALGQKADLAEYREGFRAAADPAWLAKIGALLVLLLTGLVACYASLHTAQLRDLQTQAEQWCKRDAAACAAARTCKDAAVQASRAWTKAAEQRVADKEALARGETLASPTALQDLETAAKGLETKARTACDPANARGPDGRLLMQDARVLVNGTVETLADPPDAAGVHRDPKQADGGGAPQPAPTACRDNLCGDPLFGEAYCSCHGAGELRRCWASKQRCEQDAACCSARGDCQGTATGEDTCSRQVRALSTDSADGGDAGVPHGG